MHSVRATAGFPLSDPLTDARAKGAERVELVSVRRSFPYEATRSRITLAYRAERRASLSALREAGDGAESPRRAAS